MPTAATIGALATPGGRAYDRALPLLVRLLTVMALLVCATPLALVVADVAGGALVSHEVEPTVEGDEGEGERMLAAAVELSAPDPREVLDVRSRNVPYASPDRDRRLRPPNG